MRTRARSAFTTTAPGHERRTTVGGPGIGTVANFPYAAVTYESLNETITDELPLKERSGYCKHSKLTTWWADNEGSTLVWTSSPQTYSSILTGSIWYHYVVLGKCTATQRDLSPSVGLNTFDWASASYHAMSQMRPSISDGLLLPNFIAELAATGAQLNQSAQMRMQNAEREREKRFRRQQYENSAAGRRRRENRLNRGFLATSLAAGSKVWNQTIGAFRKAAQTVAWANVAYQFAVRPTIADAKTIAHLIENYRSIVAKLIRQASKRQVRHYKRPIDNLLVLPSDRTENHTVLFGPSGVNRTIRSTKWLFRPVYHASMLFTYDASALKGMLGQLTGLITAFGVNRVASIVWEAIPFSFVVDWFVNVGSMIRSLEDQVIDPLPIVIHDFSHSVKYAYRTKLEWHWGPERIVTDLGFRDTEVYERRRDTPSLVDSMSVRLPNLNQAGLGLSLIVLRMDGITGKGRR